jgi:hypothetical protein
LFLFSEEEASEDGKEEDEPGAFISSRLVSFESILGLRPGLRSEEDGGGDRMSGIGRISS